jgi:hypothetical protein
MAILHNLWQFGKACGHLVYFYHFGTFGPIKIWQPWVFQSYTLKGAIVKLLAGFVWYFLHTICPLKSQVNIFCIHIHTYIYIHNIQIHNIQIHNIHIHTNAIRYLRSMLGSLISAFFVKIRRKNWRFSWKPKLWLWLFA